MRYLLANYSYSSHCCFSYSIIDTSKRTYNKSNEVFICFEDLCELFDKDAALNVYSYLSGTPIDDIKILSRSEVEAIEGKLLSMCKGLEDRL
jgi:hypothetical protein